MSAIGDTLVRIHRLNGLLISAFLIIGVADSAVRSAEQADQRPNILIITADNLGYGDLKSYNQDSPIRTPHLDLLAKQGVRLTDFYTASPTCTVSRACLLTGRVADRHGLRNQLPGIAGNYGVGLNQNEVLMSEILRNAGYATGCFGKWNIGFAPGSRPTERGFDQFIGHASGNIDYYSHVYNGKHDLFRGIEPLDGQRQYSSDLFADAAIEFISHESDRPWFCYLPLNAPHFPNRKNKSPGQPLRWQATDEALAVYQWSPDETDPYRRYCAVITAMDQSIGRVLKTLDDTKQSERTLVFFFSDNGAFRLGRDVDIGSNLPLRSGGVTCWEGGLRVASIARWPGKIRPGTVCKQVLWSPDLMVACARLAETELPADVIFDGRDPIGVLIDGQQSPHQSLYFTYRSHQALRMGDWKIVRTNPQNAWQLYNLKDDVAESRDLASEHKVVAKRLENEFQRWRRAIRNEVGELPN